MLLKTALVRWLLTQPTAWVWDNSKISYCTNTEFLSSVYMLLRPGPRMHIKSGGWIAFRHFCCLKTCLASPERTQWCTPQSLKDHSFLVYTNFWDSDIFAACAVTEGWRTEELLMTFSMQNLQTKRKTYFYKQDLISFNINPAVCKKNTDLTGSS